MNKDYSLRRIYSINFKVYTITNNTRAMNIVSFEILDMPKLIANSKIQATNTSFPTNNAKSRNTDFEF